MRWATLAIAVVALALAAYEAATDGAPGPARERLRYVSRYTDFDSQRTKKVIVLCPPGERMLYGGGSVGYPWRMHDIATNRSIPFSEDGREGWWYVASEVRPRSTPWEAFAVAVCVRSG